MNEKNPKVKFFFGTCTGTTADQLLEKWIGEHPNIKIGKFYYQPGKCCRDHFIAILYED